MDDANGDRLVGLPSDRIGATSRYCRLCKPDCSTGGIVLATVTRAFDLDFKITIIHDAGLDADAEVHRVLTEKIFSKRGTVVTTDAFISEQE